MNSLLKAAKEYLTLRRQLGFKLRNNQNVLIKFCSFLKTKKASHITGDLALEFATRNPNTSQMQWAVRLGIIRRFAQYLSVIDAQTEIPPFNILSYSYHRRKPYIYSKTEIVKLLQSSMLIPYRHKLKPHTYFTLFGLLAVTGMRVAEATGLKNACVDLKKGRIEIQEGKYRKSRYLQLHASTVGILRDYAKHRDRYFPSLKSNFFFVNERGSKLFDSTVRNVFIWVSKKIGLRKRMDSSGPRLIDLRHTFAVTTLTRWYQKGLNADLHIPLLSTYLGHAQPTQTYWYLTQTQDLLKLVTSRLEKYRKEDLV